LFNLDPRRLAGVCSVACSSLVDVLDLEKKSDAAAAVSFRGFGKAKKGADGGVVDVFGSNEDEIKRARHGGRLGQLMFEQTGLGELSRRGFDGEERAVKATVWK
jgi:hypothetical protein